MKRGNIIIVGSDFQDLLALKTQGQFLRDILVKHGLSVTLASKYRAYHKRILDTIISIYKAKKPSVIIIQVYSTLSIYLEFLSVFIAWIFGHKIICTLHGGDMPNVYKSSSMKRSLLNFIFAKSDFITAPSQYIFNRIPINKPSSKQLVIRNYINLDEYFYHPKKNRSISIFWMRSYHPVYNPILAVDIINYLQSQGHEVKMVMAGSDLGMKQEVENYIERKNLKDRITLLDVIDNSMKNIIASESSVYLSTNIIDNAPVSFLEMMAMGLPVVSTNVGGIPFYLENKVNGLFPQDNTSESIAKLIIQLHQDEEMRERIINSGRNFIQNFGEKEVLNEWLILFRKLGFYYPIPNTK